MPLAVDQDLPKNFPVPGFLTLNNWKDGVITLLDKSRLPRTALAEANNLWLVEDGQPALRSGTDWFGSALPNSAAIDGFDYFDSNGTIHLVAVGGGVVYRSLDDGTTWTACTGAAPTAGKTVQMNQYNSFLYITNGVDAIIRYDGTTVLQTYAGLVTPAAPTAATTPGSPGTTYTYYYKISAVNTVGFTMASTKLTVQHGIPRGGWDATTNFVVLTLPAYQGTPSTGGQTRYDIYFSTDDLSYFYLDSASYPDLTYKDDGTAFVVPSTQAPISNTTTGPLVQELTTVGIRMFGVRDQTSRYRIWFTGTGNYAGAFSNAYDGGYLDWQPGGKYVPQKVEDYRDGKGSPLATIWCSSADGQGSIIQMSLSTLTVGSFSITVPSAYQLPGSRGTGAPQSVVNVLNDYMFYNSQAFYNLGSRAQFLNLLSTDESSANIRPTVRSITTSAASGIASVFYLAKVYFSVPLGSSTNNTTMIFDTERKCWLPYAFTIGFSRFLHYTTTANVPTLLALKPGDNRLSQISDTIQGDYGVAFSTSLLTGLYSTLKDRFGFQLTDEGEIEFSNPQGNLSVELLGIERTAGFSSQVSETIATTLVSAGWDTFNWDTKNWDDTSVVPDTFSESSVKRYFIINRELNAVQWHITTSSLDARYVLRTLQTWGTDTQAGHPRQWLLSNF